MLDSKFDEVELYSILMTLNGEGECKNQGRFAEDFFPGEEITTAKKNCIRNIIRRLRNATHPIISFQGQDGGYCLPDIENKVKGRLEVLAFKEYMQTRIKSECIVLNRVLKACSIYLNEEFEQLELPF